ncbi:hypothetical protein [Aminicella lysinilytica]|nr:hypothetical protein [Aminicella lysinilytica]
MNKMQPGRLWRWRGVVYAQAGVSGTQKETGVLADLFLHFILLIL